MNQEFTEKVIILKNKIKLANKLLQENQLEERAELVNKIFEELSGNEFNDVYDELVDLFDDPHEPFTINSQESYNKLIEQLEQEGFWKDE